VNKLSSLLCPKARFESLISVDPEALRSLGIEALILDLDNTLVFWHSSEASEEIRAWVQKARNLGIRMGVASNTHRMQRLMKVCQELGIEVIQRATKPRRGALRKVMNAMNSRPESTAMVGDQLFTDVLGGNRLGLYTILLSPLSPKEFIGTRINRYLERLVLNRLHRQGLLPPINP
jgi:HAD superfamily phosphatase (TIGR01668 family)